MGGDFVQLAHPHFPYLRRQAFRLARCQDTADDLFQETLIKAWRAWAGFVEAPGQSKLRAWLYRILFNTFAGKYRQTYQIITCSSDDVVAPEHEASELSIDRCEALFGQLRDEYRHVVELRILGFSHKEIASRLGIPIGTSCSRCHHAKEILSRLMEDLCD